MADALATALPTFAPQDAVELAQKALSANQALQHELSMRAGQLEREILEADRLLEALENGADPEEAEDEIQIPGARRAFSLFPMSECLNEESPFHEEAQKRVDYLARITPQSFNAKQLDTLKAAVRAENQRLQAYRQQAGNQAALDLERNVEGVDWSIVAEKVSDTSADMFTADQCRIKWLGSQHPDFDRSEWKATETNKLFEILRAAQDEQGGVVDWVDVTKQLGTNRTVIDVVARGQPRQRHVWDRESDERLLYAVEKYGVNNWMAVAREVSDNVTPSQCQNRFNKSLDPSIKRGAWTAAEDERLTKAVAALGPSWIRVAEYVPGRTNDQCNERWTGQLNGGSSKNVWSEDEDMKLIEMVNSLGRQWKAISAKMGNGKTGPSCRLRFNKLMKTTDSTAVSTSGLVIMSPAPGTASVASSLPSATPREMSVQSELPASGTQSVPLAESSAQSTAPQSGAGETGQSAKSQGKKRAKDSDAEDALQSEPKRLKPSPKPAGPTLLGENKKKRPAPRPKPKAKKANSPQAEIATIPQQSATSTSGALVEPAAAPSEVVSPAPPRRSARITTGKASSSSHP